eukprot:3752_1
MKKTRTSDLRCDATGSLNTESFKSAASFATNSDIAPLVTKNKKLIPPNTSSICSCFTNRIPPFVVWCIAFYGFCGSVTTIGTVSVIAWYTDLPWIFPSLGASTFLHFAIPDQPPASPRNTICAHFVAGLMGYIGLVMTGLADDPVVFVRPEDIIVPYRVACLCYSIGTTCFFMILFNIGHPPAGATTIIVALGILRTIPDLCVLMGSVLILCVETWIITKIFRRDVEYPFWTNMTKEQADPTKIEADPRVFVSKLNLLERSKPLSQQSKVSQFQRQLTTRLVLTPLVTPRTIPHSVPY